MNYNFDWDPNKAKSNHEKHDVTFEEAGTVFRDHRALSLYDHDHSEHEDRWITIGISNKGRALAVCHTFQQKDDNDATIRIFSARKAAKKEIEQYEE